MKLRPRRRAGGTGRLEFDCRSSNELQEQFRTGASGVVACVSIAAIRVCLEHYVVVGQAMEFAAAGLEGQLPAEQASEGSWACKWFSGFCALFVTKNDQEGQGQLQLLLGSERGLQRFMRGIERLLRAAVKRGKRCYGRQLEAIQLRVSSNDPSRSSAVLITFADA